MSREQPGAQGLYDAAHEKDSCGVGFIAHVKGEPSRSIVADSLTALQRMSHRSACGSEPGTGDGAGLLVALPDGFFRDVAARELGLELPEQGRYAVGMVFLPSDPDQRATCKAILERFIAAEGQRLLGWRRVPTDSSMLGPSARATEPVVEQCFVAAAGEVDQDAFERRLYLARKQAYHTVRDSGLPQWNYYHVCSLSTRVVVYKGQLTPEQVPQFYPDLARDDFISYSAMFHARFSTNTFPSWSRAQPMRFLGHNGEINTLRGNVNWM
ncbi:MAG TPA: hypothetical protein VNZ57_03105, partial [Longimicrobiales bacterium]|nr:hypothetical protein [Longimicrobiales bacterium]